MSRTFTLTLEKSDVMQVLDALTDRAEAWEKTEAVLNGEFESEDIFVPEECDDPSEAADIAQHFRDIISIVEAQLDQANS